MAGLLDGMTPQQYGLLAAGLGMMGNSRGRSLGESLSAGGMQGLNAMGAMQQAQEEQQQQAVANQMRDYQFQRMVNQDAKQEKLGQALKGASSRDAISQALLENGDIESYLKFSKPQGREGIPSGFVANEDGSIAPMPVKGYGDYAQYQMALRQMPGYGEDTRLQFAANNDARAAEAQDRQLKAQERSQTSQEYANELANWRLMNPSYEKNQAAIKDAESTYSKLENSLNAYYDVLKNQSQFDRHNPLANADLQTAYGQATWPLRDDTMMNTGVLQPAEMTMLNKVLTDPTRFSAAGFRDYAELEKQKAQLLSTAKANLEAKRKALSPTTPPPLKGGQSGWQKLDDPQAEIESLRKSGDTKTADELAAMARRDALRKKHLGGE